VCVCINLDPVKRVIKCAYPCRTEPALAIILANEGSCVPLQQPHEAASFLLLAAPAQFHFSVLIVKTAEAGGFNPLAEKAPQVGGPELARNV